MSRSTFVVGFTILLEIATATAQPVQTVAPGSKITAPPIEIVPPTQHTQDVNSVVLSSDDENRFVASSGEDGVIKLWDVMTGRLIRNVARIDPNNKYWRVKALSRDGRRLLGVAGTDFKLWDTITGKEILSIPDLPDDGSIMMSKDGSRIAAIRSDKVLKVFDGYTGKELSTQQNVSGLSLSGAGRPIASTSSGKIVELWSDEAVEVAHSPNDEVSATGSHLYIEGDGETLRLRELDSRREIRAFIGQPALNAGAFSSNGSRIAVSLRGQVSILGAETGQRIGSCPSPSKGVAAFAFSSDGRQLLYGGEDKAVTLCDIENGTIVRSFAGHDESVRTVSFSPDNGRLASGFQDGTVELWEVATAKLIRTFKGNDRPADAVAFTPDGRKVLAGTDDNKVRIWDVSTGRETKTLRMLVGPIMAMAISPDGRHVGAGPYSQLMVKQWDIETGKELRRLETNYVGRFWSVTDVKYAPARDHVLAAAANNFIVVWDVDSGRKRVEIDIRDQDFKSIAFSGDGRRLVSLDEAGLIRHWDGNSGALLVTIVRFGDGEWLRVTPEGFFDSSPDGGKYLTVVRGLEIYSIDRLIDQLNRPDLIPEKLAGDPQGKVQQATAKLDLTKAVAATRQGP
jgi:WD40 repeat protein